MGDVIHTLPAVHLLRRQFPDAVITWIVNDTYAELVERSPDVDEVMLFKRRRWAKPGGWPELIAFMRQVRQKEIDIAIDFQGLLRSSLMAYFSGARRRIGFRDAREGASLLYTEKVLLPANIKHALEKNAFLVRSVFHASTPLETPRLVSYPRAAQTAAALLDGAGQAGGPILAVAPVSRWPSKNWPPEFFAEVVRNAVEKVPETTVWLVGTADEHELGEHIRNLSGVAHMKNLMGKVNFGILIELLRKSDVLLTNDSGPMHLAAALGTPVVALFGPTDPQLTGPHGAGHKIFRGGCAEGPCFRRECPLEEPGCWRRIDQTEVAHSTANYLLSSRA